MPATTPGSRVLDLATAPLVLAVTASGHPSESFYLERALAIAEGAGGFRFRAVGGPAFSDLKPEELDDVQVVAILGTRGLEQRGRELLAGYVRAGGGLLVTAGPDVDVAIVRQALQNLIETSWRPREGEPLAVCTGRQPPPGLPRIRRGRHAGERELQRGLRSSTPAHRPTSSPATPTGRLRSWRRRRGRAGSCCSHRT